MTGRLALDFGNANTVLAVWDQAKSQARALPLPPYSYMQSFENESIPLIPSLIHYKSLDQILIGNQIFQQNLSESDFTLGFNKGSLKNNMVTVHGAYIHGKTLYYKDAAAKFLSTVLTQARKSLQSPNEAIAITVPVDSYEKYRHALAELCALHDLSNVRFIDEPVAAALSFSQKIQHGDIYLIFDFGAGTLDLALVKFNPFQKEDTEKHSEVVVKESLPVGGHVIDDWLRQHFIDHHGLSDKDPILTKLSARLKNQCRDAKEKLSFKQAADITISDPDTAQTLTLHVTRNQFEELLHKHNFNYDINRIVTKLLDSARDFRDCRRDQIKAVFMVGGSSLIPSVKRNLESIFGNEKVFLSRPLDAIACGAAAFISGQDIYDHIQHNYAIGFQDPKTKQLTFDQIIQRGEKYPTKKDKPVTTRTIRATRFNQKQFQLLIYELSTQPVLKANKVLFLDDAPTDEPQVTAVCMNEHNPTLLTTKRPIQQGDKALQIDFAIDKNKQLVVNTYKWETETKKVPDKVDFPVIKLS